MNLFPDFHRICHTTYIFIFLFCDAVTVMLLVEMDCSVALLRALSASLKTYGIKTAGRRFCFNWNSLPQERKNFIENKH